MATTAAAEGGSRHSGHLFIAMETFKSLPLAEVRQIINHKIDRRIICAVKLEGWVSAAWSQRIPAWHLECCCTGSQGWKRNARLDGNGVRFRLSTDAHNVQMTPRNQLAPSDEARRASVDGRFPSAPHTPLHRRRRRHRRDVKNKCDRRWTGRRHDYSFPSLAQSVLFPSPRFADRRETSPRRAGRLMWAADARGQSRRTAAAATTTTTAEGGSRHSGHLRQKFQTRKKQRKKARSQRANRGHVKPATKSSPLYRCRQFLTFLQILQAAHTLRSSAGRAAVYKHFLRWSINPVN